MEGLFEIHTEHGVVCCPLSPRSLVIGCGKNASPHQGTGKYVINPKAILGLTEPTVFSFVQMMEAPCIEPAGGLDTVKTLTRNEAGSLLIPIVTPGIQVADKKCGLSSLFREPFDRRLKYRILELLLREIGSQNGNFTHLERQESMDMIGLDGNGVS